MRVTKQSVLKAIHGSGGIVSQIAKRLDVTWHTANKYIYKWPETQQALRDEQETILDMAESTLYANIKGGNSQDAKWILSTKGKSRGYSEKTEVEHTGSMIQIEFVNAKNTGD